jgi:hypothetical protein
VLDTVTGLAVTPTTWVVAAQFRFAPDTEGDDQAPDHEVGEAIVSGPIGGGPPTTLLRCTLDVAVDKEHVLTPKLAVSDDRVAWSGSLCPGAAASIADRRRAEAAWPGRHRGLTSSSVSSARTIP